MSTVPKKPPTLSDFRVLGETRCVNRQCGQLLPLNAPTEEYRTQAGVWVIAYCSQCKRWSPFRLEATA